MESAFKKILLAFDNSEASRVALQKACDIASKFESEITALFVSSGNKDEGFADSKKFLEDFSSSKGIELDIIEKSGKVYNEVIKLEKEGDYSLILVGSHGKKGWQPFWMGSNAFKVISSSTCPVI
ncbi:MAG: universal stress protein, partial [Bacteroidia bacterium]|nr:universal stress protein [Bacteroidia bacterium]